MNQWFDITSLDDVNNDIQMMNVDPSLPHTSSFVGSSIDHLHGTQHDGSSSASTSLSNKIRFEIEISSSKIIQEGELILQVGLLNVAGNQIVQVTEDRLSSLEKETTGGVSEFPLNDSARDAGFMYAAGVEGSGAIYLEGTFSDFIDLSSGGLDRVPFIYLQGDIGDDNIFDIIVKDISFELIDCDSSTSYPTKNPTKKRVLSCKDPKATNYNELGIHQQNKCEYKHDDVSCPYFKEYHRMGDSGKEVEKIQHFLNEYLNLSMVVDGKFNLQTHIFVQTFQRMHGADILDPWNIAEPTGYVYKTTNGIMNEIIGCHTQDRLLEGVNLLNQFDNDSIFGIHKGGRI